MSRSGPPTLKFWIIIVLGLLILAFLFFILTVANMPTIAPLQVTFFTQACDKSDVIQAIGAMENTMRRWNGVLGIAKESKGIAITRPLVDLKDIRYAMAAIKVPGCLIIAHTSIIQHMDFVVESNLQRIGGADADAIRQTEKFADDTLMKYTREIVRVSQCAPSCQ